MTAPADAITRQAQDYLAAVEHELADLPAEDRSALLEDLAQHLEALAGEEDDRPVVVRLGPPDRYAAELRAAAGLPARDGVVGSATVGLRERLDEFLGSPAGRRVVPAAREVRRLAGELRPAWWVLRGYLVVLVPSLARSDAFDDFPVPAPLGEHVLGVLLVLAAVAGSVALGRRTLSRPLGALVAAAGIVLVATAFATVQPAEVTRSPDYGVASVVAPDRAYGEYPLLSRYGPVTDVLPYAADGTPLEGVLLYDQDGRPLQVGTQEWWADGCRRVVEHPRAEDGGPVTWSFPQAYELDGVGVGVDGRPAECLVERVRPEVPLPTFPAEALDPAE